MANRRWTNSDKARIETRRMWVARFVAVGMKNYEIAEKLAEVPIFNPETGEPYDVSTVSRDISVIEERWREEIRREIDAHKAKQLAELREARRKAWAAGDVAEVRRNLETEIKLLGTDAPSVLSGTGKGGALLVELVGNIDAGRLKDG